MQSSDREIGSTEDDVISSEAAPRRDNAETEIRAHFDAGRFDRAATLFLQQYGGEILGFLVGRLGDPAVGADVFSEFTEDFWNGLPGFLWRTTMRGWAYTLARNAFFRHLNARRREGSIVPIPDNTDFYSEAARVRTETLMHLRTEVKSRMREIREQLPPDDQTLLVLRIDRKLSWNELAAVLSGLGEKMSDAELMRWSARLRQRFQTVKARLREMAAAEGLLETE